MEPIQPNINTVNKPQSICSFDESHWVAKRNHCLTRQSALRICQTYINKVAMNSTMTAWMKSQGVEAMRR